MISRVVHPRKRVAFGRLYKLSRSFFFFFADLEASQKQVETDRKAIDELIRERDILNKVHVLTEAVV